MNCEVNKQNIKAPNYKVLGTLHKFGKGHLRNKKQVQRKKQKNTAAEITRQQNVRVKVDGQRGVMIDR